MPSDPTTKDLIAAARKTAWHGPLTRAEHNRKLCTACTTHALADRLEEVEEERDRLEGERNRMMRYLHPETFHDPEPSDPEPDHITRTYEFAEAPEPTDDPWERIEDGSVWRQRAILDLGERVEDVERYATGTILRLGALDGRLTTLETEMRHRVTKVERKVESLEGHADRGSESEAELRGRVEELETEVAVARHMRLKMLGRLSELADGEGA